jgi:hypothetical protein
MFVLVINVYCQLVVMFIGVCNQCTCPSPAFKEFNSGLSVYSYEPTAGDGQETPAKPLGGHAVACPSLTVRVEMELFRYS